jgi:hypothetical protein
VATSRVDRGAMLAKDERKTGIGIDATPFIEAMSAYTSQRWPHTPCRIPEKAFKPEYILVAR